MELIKSILSKNLEELRASRNLNYRQVAEAIGVHHSTYGRWENGSGWIDSDSIEKIASFYGVRASRLFYDPSLLIDESTPSQKHPSSKEITKKLQELIDFVNN